MTIASFILGAFSLLISAYVLWATRFSRFHLETAVAARIELLPDTRSVGTTSKPAVILRMSFTNRGARLGHVDDIAITLTKKGSTNDALLFRSLFERIESTVNLSKNLPPPKLSPFTSFPIRGGETIIKEILFVTDDLEQNDSFGASDYIITPYTRDSETTEWRKRDSVSVVFTQEDLSVALNVRTRLEPDGRTYVEIHTQIKTSNEVETALDQLRKQLSLQ